MKYFLCMASNWYIASEDIRKQDIFMQFIHTQKKGFYGFFSSFIAKGKLINFFNCIILIILGPLQPRFCVCGCWPAPKVLKWKGRSCLVFFPLQRGSKVLDNMYTNRLRLFIIKLLLLLFPRIKEFSLGKSGHLVEGPIFCIFD